MIVMGDVLGLYVTISIAFLLHRISVKIQDSESSARAQLVHRIGAVLRIFEFIQYNMKAL